MPALQSGWPPGNLPLPSRERMQAGGSSRGLNRENGCCDNRCCMRNRQGTRGRIVCLCVLPDAGPNEYALWNMLRGPSRYGTSFLSSKRTIQEQQLAKRGT